MEDDGWSFGFAASSRSYQSTLKSQPDFFIEIDDFDGDEDLKVEFPCPFCSEDFDLVGLCCHIDDEHPAEATTGVCPVCATRVGMNMVGHITTQHVNFFKGQHKLKPHKGDYSTLPFSRKELQDGHFRSICGSSSRASTSKMAVDPWLSFLHNAPAADKLDNVQSKLSADISLEEISSEQALLERKDNPSPLSDKDQEEKAQRCKFVHGLLLSTILDDHDSL